VYQMNSPSNVSGAAEQDCPATVTDVVIYSAGPGEGGWLDGAGGTYTAKRGMGDERERRYGLGVRMQTRLMPTFFAVLGLVCDAGKYLAAPGASVSWPLSHCWL
jgi:hypothetical protein